MSTALAVVEQKLTLRELASAINAEHRAVARKEAETLEHVIRAGEWLWDAKDAVPKGSWVQWMDDNLEVSFGTAYCYMRIAKNQDFARTCGESAYYRVDARLRGTDEHGRGQRYADDLKNEVRRLHRDEGFSGSALARRFGVSPDTACKWLKTKREADHIVIRERRRRRAAGEALRREELARAARATGGNINKGYGLLRKTLQAYQAALEASDDRSESAALRSAITFLHRVEDETAVALKKPTPRPHRDNSSASPPTI